MQISFFNFRLVTPAPATFVYTRMYLLSVCSMYFIVRNLESTNRFFADKKKQYRTFKKNTKKYITIANLNKKNYCMD